MSSMNFLEKLLDGVEVEWMALGEVCEFKNGFAFKSSLFKEIGLPIIRITNVDGKNVDLSDVKFFDPADYKRGNPLNYSIVKGDILIAMSGATTGKIGYFNSSETAYLNQRVGKFEPKSEILLNRYLYHYLLTKSDFLYVLAGGGAQPNLSSNNLKEKLLIPIPCPEDPEKSLAIQAEIVRILDTFTELTTELTTELAARKKQYNYYRDQLLTFEEGEVEWTTLGEIVATIKTGKLNANAMVEGGEYPFYTCDANPFRIDTYAFDTEAIIVSGNGSQVGHINYYKGKFNAYQRTYILADCADEITISFLLTYLKSYLRPYIMQHSKKGSVPYITMPMLQKFNVPVPSPEEQAHIVAILDKFDALTNSISEGLPREIELRQKQYEYYRNLLLSFPASDKASADKPKPEVEA
jgi:type I restriction enzyme S subunit